MSIAAASGSSRSAGPWACRRPPSTVARPASAQLARSRTSGCSSVIRRRTRRTTTPMATGGSGRRCCAPARVSRAAGSQRLMAANGIRGAKRRGKPWRTTKADPHAARARISCSATSPRRGPNELWVADFTYLRCWEGVVFFSFVIDAFSRMIVGWQFAANMRTDLVLDALRMALTTRDPGAEVASHSSLRCRVAIPSCDYTQELDDHDVLASIGRSATPMTTRWPKASSTASRPS